jgi:hypothetical protein
MDFRLAASPDPAGPRGGYETFRDAARRKPESAPAVRIARERALGLVEKTLAERASNGRMATHP